MKTSIATALSITGVLVAGGAAYAVNSAVMDPSAPASNLASTATFAPAPGGIGAVVTTVAPDPGSVSKDGSGIGSLAAGPDPVTTTTEPDPTISTTFKVGTSGTVIASAVAGVVTIDSVSPAKGWVATRPRLVGAGVEVDFTSGSTRVDFVVRFVDGRLTGSVDSRTIDDDDRWDNPRHDDDGHDDDDDDDEHEDREDHHDEEDDD